jgi:hypothetical protein
MQGVFRRRCDDLVDAYVKASLKRQFDARELCLILEGKMRKDRRLFRRRIATLERERRISDRSIEDLGWEVEQLSFRLNSMDICLTHEVGSSLEATESKEAAAVCEEAVHRRQAVPHVDELDWTRI